MKLKEVKCELASHEQDSDVYDMMNGILEKHHSHLNCPSILIMWYNGWKPDRDGKLAIARIKIATDYEKELLEHDLCLKLNKEMWDTLMPERKKAEIDRQLCTVDIQTDEEDETPKQDDRGRTIYRRKKYDLEECFEVIKRYGTDSSEELAKLASVFSHLLVEK